MGSEVRVPTFLGAISSSLPYLLQTLKGQVLIPQVVLLGSLRHISNEQASGSLLLRTLLQQLLSILRGELRHMITGSSDIPQGRMHQRMAKLLCPYSRLHCLYKKRVCSFICTSSTNCRKCKPLHHKQTRLCKTSCLYSLFASYTGSYMILTL